MTATCSVLSTRNRSIAGFLGVLSNTFRVPGVSCDGYYDLFASLLSGGAFSTDHFLEGSVGVWAFPPLLAPG